jgi:hypothetical protein
MRIAEPYRSERWLEEYWGCSCSAGSLRKRDLPGYCGKHGGDRKAIHDVRPSTIAAVNRVFEGRSTKPIKGGRDDGKGKDCLD